MAQMGRYCKAYPAERFRAYPNWSEKAENLRKEKKQVDGQEVLVTRELSENDHFYLQENYVVTDGIFIDENIIYDNVAPEWTEFCKDTLKFEVPNYEASENKKAEEASAPGA